MGHMLEGAVLGKAVIAEPRGKVVVSLFRAGGGPEEPARASRAIAPDRRCRHDVRAYGRASRRGALKPLRADHQ